MKGIVYVSGGRLVGIEYTGDLEKLSKTFMEDAEEIKRIILKVLKSIKNTIQEIELKEPKKQYTIVKRIKARLLLLFSKRKKIVHCRNNC